MYVCIDFGKEEQFNVCLLTPFKTSNI